MQPRRDLNPSEKFFYEWGQWFWGWLIKPIGLLFAFGVRMAGPCFIVLFYYMIYLHVDVFCRLVIKVLFKRLGVSFGMLWMFVGAILGFNVCFNHTLAAFVKANGPNEVKMIEQMRL
jgi:hypothetical protein